MFCGSGIFPYIRGCKKFIVMADKKYRSFTETFDEYSSVDRFIEERTEDYSPEYELFDFSVCYRGSSFLYPYVVTVVLKKVDTQPKRDDRDS